MDIVIKICKEIASYNGRALIVGGWVRDKLIGIECKDIDIEVYHMDPNVLIHVLSNYGKVESVGVSFGVLKLRLETGQYLDFSIPRRENKQGVGHKGFLVSFDPNMSFEEASSRRDFTINAMGFDPLTGEILDFYRGQEDLSEKYLVPTSEAFKEDPLRVLRGMQFAARFDSDGSNLLDDYAKEIFDSYKELPVERVWTEWEKMVVKGKKISRGLELLEKTSWIDHYPELADLLAVPQDAEYHPEGDAFIHTCCVADEAIAIADREGLNEFDRKVLVLAAICHDFGKANTTIYKDNRWRSPGHDVTGVPLAESFLKKIGCPQAIIDHVKPLVRWHMAHCRKSFSSKSIRKLSLNMAPSNIYTLLLLIEADMNGRPPLPKGLPESALELKAKAESLSIVRTKLSPILKGKHLIELGLTPSEVFGTLLRTAFEAQVNGEFNSEEDAVLWMKEKLKCHL